MTGARDARRTPPRTLRAIIEAVAIASVPVVLAICTATGFEQTALLSFIVVLGALMLFFAGFEAARPRMRDVMPVVVLAALAAAGRILFAPFPDFKPVSAIAIIAGVTFGRRAGFMVGALAALVSNFFFGQGPWTPWQMYAWGLIGYLAGLIAQTGAFRDRPLLLYAYGFVSGILYGVVVNLWSIVGFIHPQDFGQFAIAYIAALPFDVIHGTATAVFLAVLYAPWRRKLERVKRKYGLR